MRRPCTTCGGTTWPPPAGPPSGSSRWRSHDVELRLASVVEPDLTGGGGARGLVGTAVVVAAGRDRPRGRRPPRPHHHAARRRGWSPGSSRSPTISPPSGWSTSPRPVPAGIRRRRDGRPVTEAATDRALTTDGDPGPGRPAARLGPAAPRRPRTAPARRRRPHRRSELSPGQADTAAAVAGTEALVLVVGPAGTGKTTALEPAVTHLRDRRPARVRGGAVRGGRRGPRRRDRDRYRHARQAPRRARRHTAARHAATSSPPGPRWSWTRPAWPPPPTSPGSPPSPTTTGGGSCWSATPASSPPSAAAASSGSSPRSTGRSSSTRSTGSNTPGRPTPASACAPATSSVLDLYQQHHRIHGGDRRAAERWALHTWQTTRRHGETVALLAPVERDRRPAQPPRPTRHDTPPVNSATATLAAGPYELRVGTRSPPGATTGTCAPTVG